MEFSSSDADFMRRATRLAMRGRGRVEPNPMVGCVIVQGGHVIGEGFHENFGGPHAEPNALASCTESPAGATAFVTLEPCCHRDKKTPPCVPRLIESKLRRVVIGCHDPNPAVAGRGAAQLRAAGLEVTSDVLEPECRQLAAPFFARVLHDRPYVTLKWAQTADDRIAGAAGRPMRISGGWSNRVVHGLRARSDAILVGINTVLADDPLLTVRGITDPGSRTPLRIVLDADLRIPLESRLVRTAREGPVGVYCNVRRLGSSRAEELRKLGVGVNGLDAWLDPKSSHSLLAIDELLSGLGEISHLLVEPGPTLAETFFVRNLADRLWIFRSPIRADDSSSPRAAEVPPGWMESGHIKLAEDTLTEYLNTRSPVFFAPEPSADLPLASSPR